MIQKRPLRIGSGRFCDDWMGANHLIFLWRRKMKIRLGCRDEWVAHFYVSYTTDKV